MKVSIKSMYPLWKLGRLCCAGCGSEIAKVPLKTYRYETWLCDACIFDDPKRQKTAIAKAWRWGR